MKGEAGRNAEDLEALKLIESSALRCKYIVETLLRFVRRPRQDERGPVDVNLVCEEAAALVRPQIKGLQVELSVEHPREQTWVDGNANHLAQVLINLLQNAVHAVGTKGKIRLACGPSNGAVQLLVGDDGPGIPADIRERIFEPFFTTKPEGVGTGLGLSITHRIVEEHRGSIALETEPGAGTTFTITLPPLGIE
jgi:two-component system NtrC family sensor kinase